MTRVIRDPADAEPARRAVALGTFDGVHLGHRSVVRAAVDQAPALDARSVACTFHPRPVSVLAPQRAPAAICSLEQRITKLGHAGADEVVVIAFTTSLAQLSAADFVDAVLIGALGMVAVAVGENFRFGRDRAGDADTLRRLGAQRAFAVTVTPLLVIDGEPVSSSRIRQLITSGDVATASRLLDAAPSLEGRVVRGDGRGRALGIPTANLAVPEDRVIPGEGVYAGRVAVADTAYRAAISVGTNPTFDGQRPVRVEAHLLDFAADLYDTEITIEFERFLRGQTRFASVDELVRQMHVDVAAARGD